MSKDDYFVIASKILVQLYKKFKGNEIEEGYFTAMSKQFPISEDYLRNVFYMLKENGYIEGNIVKAWGGDIVYIDYGKMEITLKGIEYLRDNSTIRKICETLKEARSIYSLFQ